MFGAALLVLACGVAVQPALAAQFERGNVLLSIAGNGAAGVSQYSPNGNLVSTFGAGGAGNLCFDPSGRYLVEPGVGLFNSSGELMPSNWETAESRGECAIDGYGQVYVAGGPTGGEPPDSWGTFRKYDIRGDLLASYAVPVSYKFAPGIANLDLAPDQCTIYYDAGGGNVIGRFDACTDVQEGGLTKTVPLDGIRVRPNRQIVAAEDFDGLLLEELGQELGTVQLWAPAFSQSGSFRDVSLDPSGTSFWLGSLSPAGAQTSDCGFAWRLSFESQQPLAAIRLPCEDELDGLAAYGSPSPQPILKKLSPRKGSAGGGTQVTITGTGFAGTTAVKFGPTNPAVGFTVNSPTSITAIAPAASAGTDDVLVTARGATTEATSKDHFKFGPLAVTAVSPDHGSAAGQADVTITGSGFAIGPAGTAFVAGSTAVTAVSCNSSTTCTLQMPSHKAGKVDIRASVAGARSKKNAPADLFTYE
jgi:hypothetical protein